MRAVQRRLGELATLYSLPDGAADQLRTLLELLAHEPTAPTTVRDPERVLQDHLADALVALRLDPVLTASTVADIGSGAGVPGLPLAIAKPSATVALVESNGRKCAFIAQAAGACRLSNTEVVHARVEQWRDGRGRFEVVTARALAPLAVVAEYAAPLLVEGGWLIAWRGMRDPAGEAVAAAAADELGLASAAVHPVSPYPGARWRHLHAFRKDGPTPPRFPRRAGMARKRPLGRPG